MADPFGPIGDLFGIGPASRAADAQEHAADKQQETANTALSEQRKIYDEEVARNKPFYDTGVEANARLKAMVSGADQTYQNPAFTKLSADEITKLNTPALAAPGASATSKLGGKPVAQTFYDPAKTWFRGPDGQITDAGTLTVKGGYNMDQSPAAKFQLTEGTKSLNRQLAARGLLGSGNASQRLAELSSGVAANDYNQQYSRLLDQVKIGTGASASAGAASSTLSGAVGQNSAAIQNAQGQAGQARAALYSGMSGAGISAANTGINAYRSGLFNGSGSGGTTDTTYDAGGADFSGNTAGSGTVDNYGDALYL